MNEQTEGDATKLFSSKAEHIKNCTKVKNLTCITLKMK